MITINLRDFYPWYIEDQLIEVSSEVAEALCSGKLYEAAHRRRVTRNKAQYSLDAEDGIEYTACLSEPTPQELLERKETFCRLCRALNSLPKAQGRRIDLCIILGTSVKEVADAEGVCEDTVRQSIKRGLEHMRKIF
ncbi:MAG: sigma-70 family RNA polymerase sigma factor [Pseudoflavonifractor sp.]|nr:sigma-70 family RNA polymerase sigma factor [Pseudoflavonifractor sp.]